MSDNLMLLLPYTVIVRHTKKPILCKSEYENKSLNFCANEFIYQILDKIGIETLIILLG